MSLLGPQVHKQAQSNIEASQTKQKVYFDAAHAPSKYCIGDLVLINDGRRQQRQGVKAKVEWSPMHHQNQDQGNLEAERLQGTSKCHVLESLPFSHSTC